jgi:hypothetical protein
MSKQTSSCRWMLLARAVGFFGAGGCWRVLEGAGGCWRVRLFWGACCYELLKGGDVDKRRQAHMRGHTFKFKMPLQKSAQRECESRTIILAKNPHHQLEKRHAMMNNTDQIPPEMFELGGKCTGPKKTIKRNNAIHCDVTKF